MKLILISIAFILLLWLGSIFTGVMFLLWVKILRWFVKMFDAEDL
ncbi:Uncharacterised protein [Streptococcus suis]|uniref:Uncharacterized protein n=1 Tax=Streptococcus suis TaxID=1307 RepID=A0A116NYB3_STRSU|nr:hypothetical protein [Streptococcus suis]CYU40608.1 Uncharacterised protein [Streptococcus suis]CYU41058.1 Uncharacterised protein [Streptococcus suis]CYU81302.1 Uncharacterised protein [Streptococcus suis]CYW27986.1 Uncharacterised protein [Streptococcus suis]